MKSAEETTDRFAGWIVCWILLAVPLVCLPHLFDFADLPQRFVIQTAALLLLGAWCLTVIRTGQIRLSGSPLTLPLFLVLVWMLLSLLQATCLYNALLQFGYLLSCLVIFLLAATRLFHSEWRLKIPAALLISTVIVSLLGCAQHLWGVGVIPQSVPPAATFANRNMAAQFVSMTLPLFGAFFFINRDKRIARILLIPGLCVSIAFLLFTQTRAAWLAALTANGLLAGAFVLDARRANSLVLFNKKKIAAALAGLALLCLSLFLLFPAVSGRLLSTIKNGFTHPAFSDAPANGRSPIVYNDTFRLRRVLWANTMEMIREHPLWGVGLGNFGVFYPRYHRKAVQDRAFSITSQPESAHNDYLQLTAELGFPGIFLSFLALCALFFMAARVAASRAPPADRLLVLAFAAMIITFLVLAFFSNPLERALPPLLATVAAAFIAARYHLNILKNRKSIRTVPKTAAMLLLLVLAASGGWALRFFVHAVQSDYRYAFALEGETAGDWPRTFEAARSAYRLNPHRPDVMSLLGRACLETDRYNEAVAMLEKAVQSRPWDIGTQVNLAAAYARLGQDARAVALLQKALAIKPDHVSALINMAKLRQRNGDTAKALGFYKEALKYDNHNAAIYAGMGFLLYKTAKYRQAARAYEAALAAEPGAVFIHKSLAWICYSKLHDSRKAFLHMQKYIRQAPQDRVAAIFRQILTSNGQRIS